MKSFAFILVLVLIVGQHHGRGLPQPSADETYLEQQLLILKLLSRFQDPFTNRYLQAIAMEYDPRKHLDDFTAPKDHMRDVISFFDGGMSSNTNASGLAAVLETTFELLYYPKTFDTFLNVSCWLKFRSNPMAFTYTFGAAFLNRDDTRDFRLPPIYEMMPSMYVPNVVMQTALRAHINKMQALIPMSWGNFASADSDGDMMYLHHDPDLIQHHMYWHVAHPFWWNNNKFKRTQDRRGELFWYTHHYALNRYNIERICMGHPEIQEFALHLPMDVGVHPQISMPSGGDFPVQKANRTLLKPDLDLLLDFQESITSSIKDGYVIAENGSKITLISDRGIDMLGDMIEASKNSVNMGKYGNLHNILHQSYSMTSDPDGQMRVPIGLLDSPHTGVMDPGFFRIHDYLDRIFKSQLDLLPPYSKSDLNFSGISILDFRTEEKKSKSSGNVVHTLFENKIMKVNYAFPVEDINDHPNVKVIFPVLSHRPFTWVIDLSNSRSHDVRAAVRIFLGPVHNGSDHTDPSTLENIRWKSMQLDRFVVTLKPGNNIIKRKSFESSSSIPSGADFETLFKETEESLESLRNPNTPKRNIKRNTEEFSHCGIPSRMILPKGRKEGITFHLAVAVTEWNEKSPNTKDNRHFPRRSQDGGSLFCGVYSGKVPDSKPSHYPFDRRMNPDAVNVPNILFSNLTVVNIPLNPKELLPHKNDVLYNMRK